MAVQEHRGVISFKDPMLGDDYYMKNTQISVDNEKMYCSRFGWLVFRMRDYHQRLVFFNPFTNDLRELPKLRLSVHSLCFSAPPTSPDCFVVGFGGIPDREWLLHVHFVAREPTWRTFSLGTFTPPLCSPAFGRNYYAFLSNKRDLIVFKNLGKDYSRMVFEAKAPRSCCRSRAQYYLVKCNQHGLLLVIVGGIGDPIEIFKPNDYTQEWDIVNCIGKHTIYICDTSNCLCIKAKMPELENKIFLPRVCSANGKIVFYSLKTQTFHTFSGKSVQENVTDISNATHLSAHTWIDPCWS